MSDYNQQNRGDHGAYARYLKGMNSSMRQKVALTAAHLLGLGKVADMGMGSGAGSHALAALYPSLSVVGVDVNPTMVELASTEYQLPNLSFIVGDIGKECFPPESLDGIFDSSVLHHVTTFSGYDYSAAERAIEAHARQLKEHGVLVVRDFVDPGQGEVLLDLPANDGDQSEDPAKCSTAHLFRRFAVEFRKLSAEPGFTFEELASKDGICRFRISRKLGTEFALRKDYRNDWDTEVLEEYTYFTQSEFERLFSRLGLRIITSNPLWNPWIVRNRYEGKFEMRDLAGNLLEYPPTNYIIVGEKVPGGEGVRFVEREAAHPPSFLSIRQYRDVQTGAVRDLVRRPHPTVDIIPWFEDQGDLYVLARKSYPRPILSRGEHGTASLDSGTAAHYVTEPLNVLQTEDPLGRTVEEALERYSSIRPDQIRAFGDGCVYYPSPGGIEEEVRSALVEIEPLFVQSRIGNLSGFSTSGKVRAIEATQLLRAAQVGGLPDARLELNVYHLLRAQGRGSGPWIGENFALSDSPTTPPMTTMSEVRNRPSRRRFAAAESSESPRFLELRRAVFDEIAADGSVVASQEFEYVAPHELSLNTIATALLCRSDDRVLIGVDDDDLPAVQGFTGNSQILVAPAWRLPKGTQSRRDALDWIRRRLEAEYRLEVVRFFELGGKYYPSPGSTAEVVYPIAAEVRPSGRGQRDMRWLDLRDVMENAADLLDGHLRIVAHRAAHAVGLLE